MRFEDIMRLWHCLWIYMIEIKISEIWNVAIKSYLEQKIFKTSTSSGAYVIASADGAVEYKDVE